MLLIVPAISESLEPLSYISSLKWICFLLVCDVAEAGWLVKYIIASFDGCSGIIVHRTVPAFRYGIDFDFPFYVHIFYVVFLFLFLFFFTV